MRTLLTLVLAGIALIVLLWTLASVADALEVTVGQLVEVKATTTSGVPVHREPRSSLMARAPNGSTGEVLAIAGRWLRVRFSTVEGWITQVYVMRVFTPSAPCDFVIPVGATEVPLEGPELTGKVICLADGEHPYGIQPPPGLGGFTVRAVTPGKASVRGIRLERNAIDVEGIRVGTSIWTRKVSP